MFKKLVTTDDDFLPSTEEELLPPPEWTNRNNKELYVQTLATLKKSGIIGIAAMILEDIASYAQMQAHSAIINLHSFYLSMQKNIFSDQINEKNNKTVIANVIKLLVQEKYAEVIEAVDGQPAIFKLKDPQFDIEQSEIKTIDDYLHALLFDAPTLQNIIVDENFTERPKPFKFPTAAEVFKKLKLPSEKYHLYINHLDSKSLLALDLEWPFTQLEFSYVDNKKEKQKDFELVLPSTLEFEPFIKTIALPVLLDFLSKQKSLHTHMDSLWENQKREQKLETPFNLHAILKNAELDSLPFYYVILIVCNVIKKTSNISPHMYQLVRLTQSYSLATITRQKEEQKKQEMYKQDSLELIKQLIFNVMHPDPITKRQIVEPQTAEQIGNYFDSLHQQPLQEKYLGQFLFLIPKEELGDKSAVEIIPFVLQFPDNTFLHRWRLIEYFSFLRRQEHIAVQEKLAKHWAEHTIPSRKEFAADYIQEGYLSKRFIEILTLMDSYRRIHDSDGCIKLLFPNEKDIESYGLIQSKFLAGDIPYGEKQLTSPKEKFETIVHNVLYKPTKDLSKLAFRPYVDILFLRYDDVKAQAKAILKTKGFWFRFSKNIETLFAHLYKKITETISEKPTSVNGTGIHTTRTSAHGVVTQSSTGLKKNKDAPLPQKKAPLDTRESDRNTLLAIAPSAKDMGKIDASLIELFKEWHLPISKSQDETDKNRVDSIIRKVTARISLQEFDEKKMNSFAEMLIKNNIELEAVAKNNPKSFKRYLYLVALKARMG